MLFRGFAFHGPAHWHDDQMEVGFFVNHFTFPAGLLFVAVHGPGKALALRWHVLAWRNDAAPAA